MIYLIHLSLTGYDERQKSLVDYSFKCTCERCMSEKEDIATGAN